MSGSQAVLPLVLLSQQVVTYVGIFFFAIGIIGGPLVLLVFLSLRTFRQSSCAFYLTIMSVVNTIHMFTGLLTFIMINGFGINWLNMSIVYCKLRPFNIQLCALISLTCMCLAVIDQFLATCSNPRWHQWNNIKIARYMIIGAAIIIVLHGIPSLIYYNHILSSLTGQISCAITNTIFQKYYTLIYNILFASVLPIITMIVFGLLAYRNVQQIAHRTVPLVRRELDKQLTRIVLVQVFSDVLVFLPLSIFGCYLIIRNAPSDSIQALQLMYIYNILIVVYYWHFVVCLLLFYLVPIITKSILYHFRVHSTFICVYQNDFVNNSFMFCSPFISIDGIVEESSTIKFSHKYE